MTSVLIVDDEPAIVRLVRDYLERAGFDVTTAGNGEDALQVFARSRPDLVIRTQRSSFLGPKLCMIHFLVPPPS